MKKLVLLSLVAAFSSACGPDDSGPREGDDVDPVDRERAAWPIQPPRFSVDGDRVTDATTGLVWELQASGGWHGYDAAEGRCGERCVGGGTLPAVSCPERERMRLPTLVELQSIVDFAGEEFRVHDVFAESEAGPYWTASPVGRNGRYVIDFETGEGSSGSIDRFSAFVRCVAGGARVEQGYEVAEGAVRDLATGLVWERQFSQPLPLGEASPYCEAQRTGGFDDWRLPGVRELHSLFLQAVDAAHIDLDAFPDAPAHPFWTATAVVNFPDDRWIVDFSGEWPGAIRYATTEGFYFELPRVRCVRGPN